MSQDEGRSPGLFSHDALPETPADVEATENFRPVFSRSDGSAPGSYPVTEQAS